MEMNYTVIQICFHCLVLKGRNLQEEVDFRTHLEASLPSVCDFAVLGNSKVDFSSLLRSTERMLQLL